MITSLMGMNTSKRTSLRQKLSKKQLIIREQSEIITESTEAFIHFLKDRKPPENAAQANPLYRLKP